MPIVHRTLTIHFERSVSGGVASTMQVAVAPLSEPNAPHYDATLVGGVQTQEVLLNQVDNPVSFDLVPTDHPDLTVRVLYRIAWRDKYLGRQHTQDFVMPDANVNFDDLDNLGLLIGGETYVQWSDRGRPGGVAGLNDDGQVVNADGDPITSSGSADEVQANLDAEIVQRHQADASLHADLTQAILDATTQLYATTSTNLNAAISQLQNVDTIEQGQRVAAVTALNNALSTLETNTNQAISQINELMDEYASEFESKADLVGGKIPSSQIPNISLGHAVTVDDEAEMLALTSDDVAPGDLCVRPDGVFFLNDDPPSLLSNWVELSINTGVTTVNGQTGAVVLSPSDIGARSASVSVPLADVSGLASALAAKVSVTDFSTLDIRVDALEVDTTLVRKVDGIIVHGDMPTDSLFVNNSGQVVRKSGAVVPGLGGSTIGDISGLSAALAAKVDTSDVRMTNSRTPTNHHNSHATGGTDPLSPAAIGAAAATHIHALTDTTGLSPLLSDHGDRLNTVEGKVTSLEASSSSPAKSPWWSGASTTTDMSTVTLRSPFGFNGSNYYYNPAGATAGEAVFPYLSPNGHLKFVARNEGAPADPALATQASLDATNATVATKAAQADLTSLTSVVGTKADSSTVATKADSSTVSALSSTVSSLSSTVATKGSQADVDALTVQVSAKADTSTVDALTTTVGTKATQSDLTALTSRVGVVETGKADLTAGSVPLSQLPAYPTSKVTGLDAALAATVSQSALDTTNANVTALTGSLAAKADLDVNGKVPSSQLPSLALTTVFSVANRAAMLALTTTQAQPGDLCLSGDTRYLTVEGTKTLAETVGTIQMVLGRQGEWTPARIESFGEHALYRVVVARDGAQKEIYATGSHRWFRCGTPTARRNWKYRRETTEVLTTDLVPGDFLRSTFRNRRHHATRLSPVGIQAGIVFGDGTVKHKGARNNGLVRLYGEKDAQLLKWFPLNHTISGVQGDVSFMEVQDLPGYFKDRPPLNESFSYLFGWLAGYFAADGDISEKGRAKLSSASLDNLRHAQDVCHLLGIKTTGIRGTTRQTRTLPGGTTHAGPSYSMGIDVRDLGEEFFLISAHRERACRRLDRDEQAPSDWHVVSVEETTRTEEVFCAIVPAGQAFVLEDNILTGNCVITATADQGSYILATADPSDFSHWTKLVAPTDSVASVNGQTGTVTLTATDVGARASATPIAQADITGLVTALAGKVDTSTYTSGLATKAAITDVQTILSDSVVFKQKVDYVATANISSLSGQQSVDGVLVPLGSIVLLTAQSSSVNNGLWTVNAGSWTRTTDMAAGAYFVKDSVAAVVSGTTNASTVWQQTNTSGLVGTNANNWTKILTAGGPIVYTASLGVEKLATDFRAKVVAGGGLSIVTTGLQVDRTLVPYRYAGDVPASGSGVTTVTHNLGTTDIVASFRDKASGDAILCGWKPTGINTLSAEFDTPPVTGQWRVTVIG